jgi:hypothetical protein
MRVRYFLISLLLIAAAVPAQAFERPFPSIAKRGKMSTAAYPIIAINGKERTLSVGAWIKNVNNTIDMPASLRGQEFTVNYTENIQGEVDRVWILSAEEAQKPAPSPPQ